MKVLIISATLLEIHPLLEHLKIDALKRGELKHTKVCGHEISVLITGIGMMQAAYYTGVLLQNSELNYDKIINVGIAGAFEDKGLQIGDVVNVSQQSYGDFGVWLGDKFKDVFDLGFEVENAYPYKNKKIDIDNGKSFEDLPSVRAVSVNTVSSNRRQIQVLKEKYDPEIEVMEGIGVQFAAKQNEVQICEIRAISNFVEVHDKSKWNIPLAVKNLNQWLLNWINALT